MKTRYNLLLLLLCLMYIPLVSQSHIRLNNYWDNTFSLNPASINDSYIGTISMATRQQWVNFLGAPSTYLATGTLYFEDYYTQIGMKILSQKKGLTNNTQIDLSYAYALLLRNDWVLNMGVALNYQNFSYDVSKITFPVDENPSTYERLIETNNLNSDIGIELNHFTYKLGFSSLNIFSLVNPKNDLHPNTNLLYAMYRQQNSDYLNLGVGLSAFQYSNIYQMEFNATAFLKKTGKSIPLQLGLFYRTWHEVGFIFGAEIDRMKITYSVDYNLGLIREKSFGTHEIMFTFNLKRTYRCRNCGWLNL